jgi:hypothetical protein
MHPLAKRLKGKNKEIRRYPQNYRKDVACYDD